MHVEYISDAKMNMKPNFMMVKEPRGFIKAIELVSLVRLKACLELICCGVYSER